MSDEGPFYKDKNQVCVDCWMNDELTELREKCAAYERALRAVNTEADRTSALQWTRLKNIGRIARAALAGKGGNAALQIGGAAISVRCGLYERALMLIKSIGDRAVDASLPWEGFSGADAKEMDRIARAALAEKEEE